MNALLANAPAEPAILFAEEVDDLLQETRHFLDGEPIANDAQAEAVSSLLNRLRRVSKDADAARSTEKKPHDDAGKAVQARWKPILDKCELAAKTAKDALAPWLRQIENRQRTEADAARVEADRMRQIAAEAHASASGDLTAREDAERLLKAASAAQSQADRAGKAKAHATGGERAIGLVDVFTPDLVDPLLAIRHYWAGCRADIEQCLIELARQDVRAGVRVIPGFHIEHTRIAR